MFEELFTNQITQAPQLTWPTHLSLFVGLLTLLYLAGHYRSSTVFRRFFWWLQFGQVIALYGWYLTMAWPLSESLPFYHCRLAILFLLWAKPGPLKRYFAYLGLFGSFVAFIYPVFDPFTFPHITILSYVIGHYALAVNSFLYLLSENQLESLGRTMIVRTTLVLNSIMFVVNLFVRGNYGFLTKTPILNSTNIALNFLLVTFVFVFAILLVEASVHYWFRNRGWSLVRD